MTEATADIVAFPEQAHVDERPFIAIRTTHIFIVKFGRIVKRHEFRTAFPLFCHESFSLWLIDVVLEAFVDELADWEMLHGGFGKGG